MCVCVWCVWCVCVVCVSECCGVCVCVSESVCGVCVCVRVCVSVITTYIISHSELLFPQKTRFP